MNYKYKAFNKDKKIITGEIEVFSEKEALDKLRQMDLRPIKVIASSGYNKDLNLFFKNFSGESLYIFLYQLYILLNSKITSLKAFDILKYTYKGKKADLLNEIYKDLASANPLSLALKNTKEFPELVTNMVAVGENSSNLPDVLKNLSEFYRSKLSFEKKIKNALIYPIILLIVTFIVVNFLILYILPTFEDVFKGSDAEFPLITKMLINLSHFINNNIFAFILVFLLILVIIAFYIRSDQGRFKIDRFKLKFDLFRLINISNFISMMKLLIESNVTVSQSVDIIARSSENLLIKKILNQAASDIYQGESLSNSLSKSEIFSEMDISMLRVGEESSNLKEVLESLNEYYRYEIEIKQEKFISLFEPVVILILSIFVGFIVISLAMPMFDLVNSI
ncbi:type II secretion system F family protein [Peptoniphilus catoniae]|uniref:type II secretion system F family protein n=1 Tax=Peptoniphilus catoniae TaxID=1660341 RepID=UPI0010FDA2EC|nr:type II secretion system F family protein [Peptoniphilus catoniae]